MNLVKHSYEYHYTHSSLVYTGANSRNFTNQTMPSVSGGGVRWSVAVPVVYRYCNCVMGSSVGPCSYECS